MGNERLRTQLGAKGMAPADLASAVEVDPKTVERWIYNGRVPHQRHRATTARLLEVDESYLWPELLNDDRVRSASDAEVLAVYPSRAHVPADLWRRLADQAREQVEILVYSGLFLLDTHPDLPANLAQRAERGLEARLLYGDPDSETVAWRGEEEGIGDNLAARIRLSLTYMAPAIGTPGIDLRQHDTVLYNSIYRFDDEMLVNTHVVGSPAPSNPVLHLRQVDGGHLFDHYLRSFERVWSTARPLEGSQSGMKALRHGRPH